MSGETHSGQWRQPAQAEANVNPSDTRDVVGEFGLGGAQDVRDAIAAARQAFPGWSTTTPQQPYLSLEVALPCEQMRADHDRIGPPPEWIDPLDTGMPDYEAR